MKKEEYSKDLIEQWKSKALHGRYPAELEQEGVDRRASVMWLTDGYMYPETEGFMIAIQDGGRKYYQLSSPQQGLYLRKLLKICSNSEAWVQR